MFTRISGALLIGAISLSATFSSFASDVLPQWQLRVDGVERVIAKAGDFVNITLRGQQLAGASAVLSIRKFDGTMSVLSFLTPDTSVPMVLRLQIPATARQPGNYFHYYDLKIIGLSKDGTRMQSNTAQIILRP